MLNKGGLGSIQDGGNKFCDLRDGGITCLGTGPTFDSNRDFQWKIHLKIENGMFIPWIIMENSTFDYNG